MSTPELQTILAEISSLKEWRRKHVMEFAEFKQETQEQLEVIKPVAEQIAEILKYSRTTSQVVIWTARIGGSVATIVGIIVAITRWFM